MKLTSAQQDVMYWAKLQIDQARTLTFEEWLSEVQQIDAQENPRMVPRMFRYYEDRKNAIVSTHCNSRTLEKLQTLGLIEIIHDSKNDKRSYGIDKVKILNY